MPLDIKQYSDSEIQVALGVAIRELGLWREHRSPQGFSAVRSGEIRLKLAEFTDVEKPAAYSCLDQNKRKA